MGFITFQTWKLSAAWLNKTIDCTVSGIVERCGGQCCKTKGFWPPNAYPKLDNVCGHCKHDGCDMPMEQRPITCLLYPLKLNKHNTLVLHSRCTYPKGICKGNYGKGTLPIIVALEAQFVHLFGQAEYNKIRHNIVDRNRDYTVTIPDWVLKALAEEEIQETAKAAPIPRG